MAATPSATSTHAPTPGLLAEQRQERRLEEQVAELVEQLRREAGLAHGVGDLVRLLDGVRDDRGRRLRAIPRALAAQQRGQLEQRARRGLGGLAREQRPRGQRRGVRWLRASAYAAASGAQAVPAERLEARRRSPSSAAASASGRPCGAALPAARSASSAAAGTSSGSPGPSATIRASTAPLGAVGHCVAAIGGRVARRELDVLAELDLGPGELLRDVLLARLLDELAADLLLERGVERPRALGQDRPLGLDQVPAELGLGRLRDDALGRA